MSDSSLWFSWLPIWPPPAPLVERRLAHRGTPAGRAACPHCTNTDTLRVHCRDDRCGWVHCTCGALIYSDRRHRHPRHSSATDTCHDPKAAI